MYHRRRDVSVLVEAYASEEASSSTIMALQKGLCPSVDLNLETDEEIQECQEFMETFMPVALELIAKYVTGTSRQYCNDLFDVCNVQTDAVSELIHFLNINYLNTGYRGVGS